MHSCIATVNLYYNSLSQRKMERILIKELVSVWNVLRGKKEQMNYFDGITTHHSIRKVKKAVKLS